MSELWVPGQSDPYLDAWRELKACIEGGAAPEEYTAYARELGRSLAVDARDTAAMARCFEAMAEVIRDIETLS